MKLLLLLGFWIIFLQNILSTKKLFTWIGYFGLFTKAKRRIELTSRAHFQHNVLVKKVLKPNHLTFTLNILKVSNKMNF